MNQCSETVTTISERDACESKMKQANFGFGAIMPKINYVLSLFSLS